MATEDNYIGIAMGLDVTSLKAGLSEANKSIQLANSQFKKATAGLEDWTKSAEGIRAKVTQLTSVLDLQKKKLSGLQAEYDKTVASQGENSEAARKLLVQMNNQASVIGRTERELNNFQETLKKAENGSIDLESVTLKAGKAIDKTGDKAKESSKDIISLDKASEAARKGLKGLYAGIVGLGGSFLATAELTREFRENMAKVETSFDAAGFSAKDAEKTYKDFYAVLGDDGQATEAVSHLSQLAKTQKDLETWTTIATGVYGRFGDSLPIEGLTEAANETAKTGQLTGNLADALNWAGENEDAFQEKLDKVTTEQERQKLITETLNRLYSESATKYRETNSEVMKARDAQAELSEKMAEVGAIAEPIMTEFKLMGATMLEAILPVVEDMIPVIKDNLPAILGGIAGVTAAVVALSAASLVQKGITTAITVATTAWNAIAKTVTATQWLLNAAMNANPISLIIIAIGALVAAFVVLWNKSDAFREFWIALWEKIKTACSDAWTAIVQWFSDAWESIKEAWNGAGQWFSDLWEGIKAVWGAVTTWFGEIFTTAWEGIKTAWGAVTQWFTQLWESIKKVFSTVATWFQGMFEDAWSNIKTAWSTVVNFFTGIWTDIKSVFSSVTTWFKEKFDKAWSNIKAAFSTPTKFFSEVWEDIKSVFDPAEFLKIGENLIKGLWDGINGVKDWIVGKAKGVWNAITGSAEKSFDEHSPSKVFAAIGRFLGLGLAEGIEDSEGEAVEATEGMGTKIIDGIKGVFDGIKNNNIFSGLWDFLSDAGSSILKTIGEALGIDFAKMFAKGVESESSTIATSMAATVSDAQMAVWKAQDEYWKNYEPPVPDTRTAWQKFTDGIKENLDKADQELQNWKNNVGKYISQVADYFDKITSNIMKVADAIVDNLTQGWQQEIDSLDKRLKEEEAKRKEANQKIIDAEKDKTDKLKDNCEKESENDIAAAEESASESLKYIQQQYLDGKISAEEYAKQKTNLEKKLSDQTTAIKEKSNARIKQLENDLVAFQKQKNEEKSQEEIALQRERDELGRKIFEANKATQIANVGINAAAGIARAWAENFWPVALGISAAIGTAAAVQVDAIMKQQYTPALAKGGVVTNPTMALIGEAGKEAVLPLERNTGWMAELADKLARFLNEDLRLAELKNNLGGLQEDMGVTKHRNGSNTVTNNDNTKVINAGLTVNYNGSLSRKQLKKTEEEYYRNIRKKLAMEGA